jgi:putative DNA primase/helicase
LPRLGDASAAIIGRFIMLVTTRSWLGKEDSDLEHALQGELPGILNWALAGLQRIINNAIDSRTSKPGLKRWQSCATCIA